MRDTNPVLGLVVEAAAALVPNRAPEHQHQEASLLEPLACSNVSIEAREVVLKPFERPCDWVSVAGSPFSPVALETLTLIPN